MITLSQLLLFLHHHVYVNRQDAACLLLCLYYYHYNINSGTTSSLGYVIIMIIMLYVITCLWFIDMISRGFCLFLLSIQFRDENESKLTNLKAVSCYRIDMVVKCYTVYQLHT